MIINVIIGIVRTVSNSVVIISVSIRKARKYYKECDNEIQKKMENIVLKKYE